MNGLTAMAVDDKARTKDLIEYVYSQLDCKDELTKDFIDAVLVGISTFDRKQRQYGPRNIAAFGDRGVLVRSHDKMARLVNLYEKDQKALDEPLEDSWLDMGVYSFIALMCRWGKWPGVQGAADRKNP